MATTEYIVALEISTSKIQGAVGINSYNGTTIVAHAQEPVNGFISKGVVRNIDETGRCISNVINKLEEQLGGKSIEKAYISINGMSVRSIKSSVTEEFSEYTKITQYIIDRMACENDVTANIPADCEKIQVITQEYKLGGDPCLTPIGMSVNHIEGNYVNIVVKSQFMRQLQESLAIAKVEIADSFTAAKINAEELLTDTEKRDGCALVDIGAETTTLTIYSNGILRSLCVLPIGSANITRDLAAEHISYEDAETLKKYAGYNSDIREGCIKKELRDKIIGARMTEILQNINHRIKNSNEKIIYTVFTGDGSQLKNIEQIIAENLPGIRMRIASNPLAEFVTSQEHQHKGEISPILLGLIKSGRENCCHDGRYGIQEIFTEDDYQTTDPVKADDEEPYTADETPETEETATAADEPAQPVEAEVEEDIRPTDNKKKKKGSRMGLKMKIFFNKCGKRINKLNNGITTGVMTFVKNATKTEEDVNFDDSTPSQKE